MSDIICTEEYKTGKRLVEDCWDHVINIVGAYGRNICSYFNRIPKVILGSPMKYFPIKSCCSLFILFVFSWKAI